MRRMSIGFKMIAPMIATIVICFGIMFSVLLVTMQHYDAAVVDNSKKTLLEGYRKELKSATEVAASLIAEIYRTPGLSDQAKLDLARRMVRPLRFGTDGYYYAYHAGDGINLIHGSTPANEGKSLWDLQSPDGKQYIIRDLDKAAADGTVFVQFYWSKLGGKQGEVFPKLGTALTVPGTDIWVGTGEYTDSINRNMEATAASFHRMSRGINDTVLVVFLLFTAVFLAVIVLRIRRFIKPVENLSAFLSRTGGTDFTDRPVIRATRYPDEIDGLYRSVDDLFVRFSDVIRRTQETAERSRQIGDRLRDASQGISGSLDETGKGTMSIREGAVRLDEETRRNSSVSKELGAFIEGSNALARKQAGSVEEASAAVAGMSSSIAEIAGEAEKHAETARSLDEAAQNGAAAIDTTVRLLTTTSENAASISDVLALIDEIADRTNLLAMNAAIEAAHAGASGKGFAVVADEIRKLAESSSGNAKDIASRLREMAGSLETSRASAVHAKESFERIVGHTAAVSQAISHMKDSALRLDGGRATVNGTLEELVELSGKVAASSGEANGKMRELSASIDGLAVMSGTTKSDLERMERALDGIRDQAGQVREAADQNVAEASSLADLVLRFKV